MFKWLKYALIRAKSSIWKESVVDFCGSTYMVYGKVVKKIRA